MKLGTENRTKTIAASALGIAAACSVGFLLYNNFSTPETPPPTVAPLTQPATQQPPARATTPVQNAAAAAASRPAAAPSGGNAPGVAAVKLASASTSLDPTLDQSAMLRAEHLVYEGSGRNIFSAIYTAPVKIPAPAPFRKTGPVLAPTPPPVPLPPPTCPPSCPPIPLKFFGTSTRRDGSRQAFILQGEDVFLASPGDIVARRYKIANISANSIQVEDLTNNNTQTLPLQSN